MATNLSVKAIEESTYVVVATFTDENGAAASPNAGLTWSLTDLNGNYINSRQNVAITAASTVNIVLSGDDLALVGPNDSGRRVVTIEGTYDSATLGAGLPIKGEARFDITDLVIVQ